MCGICGVYGLEDKALIKRMSDVISYRGPDDSGYYFGKNIMLGHRRLSIIDLKTGKQPIFNEDKSCCVIFNGEIYNFKELRGRLENLGHRFYTNTDTEAIIHAYEEYGFDCVKQLNGMFAFAIWDSDKKLLFLARDRTGIKPLFYAKISDKFLFGSEVKSILQYKDFKKIIDKVALHQFINLRYIPGQRTIFKNINKLLPGHYLIYRDNKISIKRYWSFKIEIEDKPLDYFIKNIQTALNNSIKRQLISDVPVAAYLSGGIDSSTIVAIASKYTDRLKTFCLGFGEPTDELKDAQKVAEIFGTEHKEFILEFDILRSMPETIWHIDMPKRNMWPYFIAKEIAKNVKVVLSGLGGDEVFGGYIQRYKFMKDIETVRDNTSKKDSGDAEIKIKGIIQNGNISNDHKLIELERIRSINNNAILYTLITHHNKLYSDFEYLKRIYSKQLSSSLLPQIHKVFEPYFKNNLSILDATFLAEFNTKLPDDFLLVEDACSMAHSLESRVPFLDNELIALGFRIPAKFKVYNGDGKFILKKAMSGILPKDVLNKKKWGFVPNIISWYKSEFRDFASEILPKSSCVKKYFNMGFIMKILQSKPSERLASHYNLIWDLVCLEVWHKIYMENDNLFNPQLDIDRLF